MQRLERDIPRTPTTKYSTTVCIHKNGFINEVVFKREFFTAQEELSRKITQKSILASNDKPVNNTGNERYYKRKGQIR